MRVLFLYSKEEANYNRAIDYLLNVNGIEGVGSTKTFTITEALAAAKKIDAKAIVICSEPTLANFVDDPSPTLSNWRGSRINTPQIPTFVVDKIANVYHTNEGRWLLDQDLKKVHFWNLPAQTFNLSILRTVNTFDQALALLSKALIIGMDIETNQWSVKKGSSKVPAFSSLSNNEIAGLGETWITVVSFTALMPDARLINFVLPIVNGCNSYWTNPDEYAQALLFLQRVCALPSPKCFHNGMYDCFHLIRYNCFPRNWVFDTMGLSHSWYSELPKTLDFLSSWTNYDHSYWKYLADAEHKAKSSMDEYWKYAGLDTWRMMRGLIYLLQEGEDWMYRNYAEAFPLVYPFTYGAFEGLAINNATRLRILDKARLELAEAKQDLQTMVALPDFNPASSQQTSTFLYDVMGAKRPPRAKSKSATGKKERSFVASQHPILALFVDRFNSFAINAKAISTYFNFLQWNSRLMFSVDPFGTDTGRAASRKSAAWIGTQIQNQPPYAKEMYEPDPGYILFEMDYSKAEAMCTAYLCQCVALIKALADPDLTPEGEKKDFYKVLGELFFGMKYEDVTKEFRNKVLKKIQHGTNYMMGEDTFIDNLDDISTLFFAAQMLGITVSPKPSQPKEMTAKAFAKMLLESYHIPFPEVRIWWEKIMSEVVSTGKLVNPATGHVRVFFGDPKRNRKIQRSAVAHQSQNCSVAELNKGYLRGWKYASSFEDKTVLRLKTQVHDSVVGQVKIEYAREVLPKLAELLVARLEIHGRLMTIQVDIEVTHTNWKEKVEWPIFSTTTLPMLESQRLQTLTTDG